MLDPTRLTTACFARRNTRMEPDILDQVWARTRAMSELQRGAILLGLLLPTVPPRTGHWAPVGMAPPVP